VLKSVKNIKRKKEKRWYEKVPLRYLNNSQTYRPSDDVDATDLPAGGRAGTIAGNEKAGNEGLRSCRCGVSAGPEVPKERMDRSFQKVCVLLPQSCT
jgi:hypothetical protein